MIQQYNVNNMVHIQLTQSIRKIPMNLKQKTATATSTQSIPTHTEHSLWNFTKQLADMAINKDF